MKKPNILFVMADQLTFALMGAYGHKVVKTPNIDKLMNDGIRFDNVYSTCPLCAPARASLMTGQYVSDIKCHDNATTFASEVPTFAHFLTLASYETTLSGKMHFVGPDQLHGFEKRLTTDIYPASFDWTPEYDDPNSYVTTNHGNARMYMEDMGVNPWDIGRKYDEETHYKAMDYLYDKGNYHNGFNYDKSDDSPFFLCVSYTNPHDPFFVTQDLWDLYEDEQIDIPDIDGDVASTFSSMDKWLEHGFHKSDKFDITNKENLYKLRRSYYGKVTYIDNKVGELVHILEESGLREDTIIIFTSDHGDMLGEKGMVQKRRFFEWSARVPLIINYPDKKHSGKKVNTNLTLNDLAPTFLDMASSDYKDYFQGNSVLDYIDNDDDERIIFSEYHGEGVIAPCFMVKKGSKKLTYVYGYENLFFDLEKDPNEDINLIDVPEYQSIIQELIDELYKRFDPAKIQKEMNDSRDNRRIIKKAMKITGTKWDYQPFVDATKIYAR